MDSKFKSHGEFARAVYAAAAGRGVDSRLVRNEGDGGVSITEDNARILIQSMIDAGDTANEVFMMFGRRQESLALIQEYFPDFAG